MLPAVVTILFFQAPLAAENILPRDIIRKRALYSGSQRVVSLWMRMRWCSLPVVITRNVSPIGEKPTLRTVAGAK